MGKWDQGLGAIGLIGLALALTTLVTIGVPISVSKESVELKDWLGFAGNILGALGTLIAAYIAWRAVQGQIGVDRDAAILDILMREEDRLEAELHALSALEDIYYACAISGGVPAVYWRERLSKCGLSENIALTREAIKNRLGATAPPMLLEGAVIRFCGLCEGVANLERLNHQHAIGQKVAAELLAAEADVVSVTKEIARFMDSLTDRKSEILGSLLPRCRSRIEAGLAGIHG